MKKNKGGRPKTTIEALPDNWRESILNMMAQGMSDVEVRANLCLSTGTFNHRIWYALQERDKEFCETIQIGRILCQAWWERVGREGLKEQVFQTGCWYANMKNRFGWRDKAEVDHTGEVYLSERLKESEDRVKSYYEQATAGRASVN